jgi:hypothetical protein
MKTALKVMGGVLLAGAVLTAPAQAQGTSYYTQGFFSSPVDPTCNSAPFNPLVVVPLSASCVGGGFTLSYTPESQTNVGDLSITSLGHFLLTGTGTATALPGQVTFQLAIRQTAPTVGTGFATGFITGTVTTSPSNSSSLIWTPNQFVNINQSTYRLIFDNVGPAADIGLGIPINASRGIDAQITTAPEPASVALLATGLLGVFGVARRRRKVS